MMALHSEAKIFLNIVNNITGVENLVNITSLHNYIEELVRMHSF